MISRYSIPELTIIWSEKAKYESWLLVEIASLEAYKKYNNNITDNDIAQIKTKSQVDVKKIQKLEQKLKHDVIAFIEQISQHLGPEKKWLHYGLTSTDVVDTAQSYRLWQVNNIIEDDLIKVILTLKKQAIKYKNTFQIGRTHGVHAEVTTFGYKLALWYDEMTRNLTRFQNARQQIEVAKISGAVGNYANVPLGVQDAVAKKLHLNSSNISTQTLQRDRHAQYLQTIALIATSLDKFAIELRHLQRTEVREVFENFNHGQKGSSAMPHKQNPISSENISGLARVIRGYSVSALENVGLWHERDISHSSSERIILPDATTLIVYLLRRFNDLMTNLYIDQQKMKTNIYLTHGVIFSQRIMLYLIEKKGYDRIKIYEKIQKLAAKAFEKNLDFEKLLVKNKLLTINEYQKLTNLDYYAINIEKVFKRLNLQ